MCFVLLLLFVPLYFAFDTKELFEFNKMLAVYSLSTIIAGAWIGRMILQQRFIWQSTILDIPLLVFLISQLLSTIFSIHPRTSILGYYSRFHGGLLSTISYMLLYWSFVAHIQKKDLPTYFLSGLLGGLLVSLYAIPEHFGHSLSCVRVGSGFDVSCWKQDVQSRVFATFGQPNWLAAYVITLLPLGGFLALFSDKTKNRLFAILTTTALFVTLLFTQSRSGLLGFVTGLIVTIVFAALYVYRRSKKHSYLSSGNVRRVTFLVLPLAVALLTFGSVYTPSLQKMLTKSTTTSEVVTDSPEVANRLEIGGSSSAEIRKIVWRGAVAVWKRYPVLGSGVETFAYSYYLDRPVEHNQVSEWNFLYNKAHNEFLNFLATTGIVGLASYLGILITAGAIVLRTLQNKNTTNKDAAISIAVISGIAALSTSNFFGFSTVMVTVLLFFYLAIVAIQTKNNTTTEKKTTLSTSSISTAASLQLVLLAGATGWLLLNILQTRRADVLYARGTIESEQNLWESALRNLTAASLISSQEAQYTDTLALTYARAAATLALTGEATAAAQLAKTAIELSDQTLLLNPEQRNFYKTRAQIFLLLAQLDTSFLTQAKGALKQAIALAPTDAKTLYNLGIVTANQGDTTAAIEWLKKAVAFKPNYDAARLELSKQLLQQGKYSEAIAELEYILTRQPEDTPALELIEFARSQQKQ